MAAISRMAPTSRQTSTRGPRCCSRLTNQWPTPQTARAEIHGGREMAAGLADGRLGEAEPADRLADARRLCAEESFDVILCDIGLPDGNGAELAPLVRGASPATRLIALSGYGQPEDRQRSAAAGFDAHLKPVAALRLITQKQRG